MSDFRLSGGTALADPPDRGDDEFALDVRLFVAYGPVMGDCPTDDGCGNTCEGEASACNSFADDPS
ncbi:FxLD family lanthipeptide [Saccharopolyspora phatthalungensis]|uniref:FxLD family lantipeptide n=1 Tax=Saccharopolyspora phatthalungensis TaxID=664693 RepID=A0A840QCB3_9PSEU|nr:FxLD family lanthipeptide [Saccharopolyspora phatthalungensis]MBB5156085.1 FxLD family lantipeptide [Saccharopolyspora phatthalungensis]